MSFCNSFWFSPISLHHLLCASCASGDGFRSQVSGFLLRLPIVRFALSGVVFCLDFSPFFFLLLFNCRVFFLIYLFRYLESSCCFFSPSASIQEGVQVSGVQNLVITQCEQVLLRLALFSK